MKIKFSIRNKYLFILFASIFFIIGLFLLFSYTNIYEYFNDNDDFDNNTIDDASDKHKWIVLLTTCVSPSVYGDISEEVKNKRKENYEKSIRSWITKTKMPIFVVESSGYNFENLQNEFSYTNRLFVYTFESKEKFTNSSIAEYKSLVYALKKMKETDEYKNCKYILKVTGKYFFGNIEKYLQNVIPN